MAKSSDFFDKMTKNPNRGWGGGVSYKDSIFFLLAWGGVGVSDFFDKFAKNPNLIFFFLGGGGAE